MLQNTALAMWDWTNEVCTFDFATYAKCKRILQIKDVEIADLYSRIIPDNTSQVVTHALDVGSSDGSLLRKVIEGINAQGSQPFVIDCVEPDGTGLRQIRHMQRVFKGRGITLNIIQDRIQGFISYQQRIPYDIILCTHLFYHIDRMQWDLVISRLLSSLKMEEGRLLICLVSYSSDIYRIWDSIAPTVASEGLSRRFNEEGDLIFAEDMRAFLAEKGIKAESHKIEAMFRFSGNDCKEYREKTAQGCADKSFIMQFIAYMLRLYPEELMRVYDDNNIELCKSDAITYRGVDYVFEILI